MIIARISLFLYTKDRGWFYKPYELSLFNFCMPADQSISFNRSCIVMIDHVQFLSIIFDHSHPCFVPSLRCTILALHHPCSAPSLLCMVDDKCQWSMMNNYQRLMIESKMFLYTKATGWIYKPYELSLFNLYMCKNTWISIIVAQRSLLRQRSSLR